MNIYDSTFSDNEAYESTGLEIMNNDENINIVNCKFINNKAKSITANIYITDSLSLGLGECTFMNMIGNPWKDRNNLADSQMMGNFIHLAKRSEIFMLKCKFINGRAY